MAFTRMLKTVLAVSLLMVLAGCGAQKSSFSGGGTVTRKPNQYKAQDAELVKNANAIPVYSTPDSARRTMRRQPDQQSEDANGVITQYYNSDDTPNSERLRLKYANGHLIGKEIVPPDANASGAMSNTGVIQPYGNPNSKGSSADNANAQINNEFNAKLNATANRRY